MISKSFKAKLMDKANTWLLQDVQVNIDLIPHPGPVEKFTYEAQLRIEGNNPALGDQSYVLILEKITGRVFLTTPHFDNKQTIFKLTFEDDAWSGWIKSLLPPVS